MTEKDAPAPTVALVLNREELSTLYFAAIAKKVETAQYLRSYDHVADSPTGTDSCCQAHLARWYEDRRQKTALEERMTGVTGLTQKIRQALKELPAEQTPDHP